MFLCYGQEEFNDCRDDDAFDVPLALSDMLEQRQRTQKRDEKKEKDIDVSGKYNNGETFSSKVFVRRYENFIDGDVEKIDDDGLFDQSSFAGGLGVTRLNASHLDEIAAAYDASLTPEALIRMRETRRKVRNSKNPNLIARQRTGLSTASVTPVKEQEESSANKAG